MTFKNYAQKPLVLIAAIFVAVSLVSFGVAYTVSQKNHKDTKSVASPSANKETQVKLLGKTADPDTITVTKGSFVQFNSADGGQHDIALEHAAVQHTDDSEYHSGTFQKDEAWRVQFKENGTYTFRDTFNPDLKINVVVYTPGQVQKIK